jgi:NTP pyrophosphatase (non-canonical NTP hydrolase)
VKKNLTLDEYQNFASGTAVYPGRNSYLGLMYVVGKLNGEAGEVAEYVFKGLRDDGIVQFIQDRDGHDDIPMDTMTVRLGIITEERRLKLKKELGDVFWYVSQAVYELGYTLQEVASGNIFKLADRAERGVLHGAGDER